MQIVRAKSYEDLSKKAAIFIASQMILNPKAVLGFATGSSPLGVYRELISLYEQDSISFEHITSFNLDEYYGLSRDHPQSYYQFMRENLFSRVNIDEKNCNIPNGIAPDTKAECLAYEEKIRRAGGIDLQLLGIGTNGHIGFNEPSDVFAQGTYLVNLTADTKRANAKYFSDSEQIPNQAISMGIGTIMHAKRVLLIANGPTKKEALYKMINRPVTPQMPASVLQFHRNATVIYCD